MALWTHYVAVQLQPDLLDRIPVSNTINSGSTELETTATGNDEEETNNIATGDDAEITADENSTDMVSSSKDEDETTTDGELKSEQNCISGMIISIFEFDFFENLRRLNQTLNIFFYGVQPAQMIAQC